MKLVDKQCQKNKGGWKRHLSCFFHTQSRGGCGWKGQEVYIAATNQVHLKKGNVPHGEHKASASIKAQSLLGSPSKLRDTPRQFKHRYISANPNSNHEELRLAEESFKRHKYEHSRAHLPRGIRLNSRAAVKQTLDKHLFSVKSQEDSFDENTVYLCRDSNGEDYVLDPGRDESEPRVVAVFSSQELLLNLYRQSMTGQDIHFMMDASYRVSTERKCGYLPVKIGTLTQTGRTVAFAVITKEDGNVHEFVTDAIVTSLEAVVNNRIQRGDGYV